MTDSMVRRHLISVLGKQWDQLSLNETDWAALERAANAEKVAPLVYEAIRNSPNTLSIQPEIFSRLNRDYLQTQAANMVWFATLADVLKRLSAVGIQVIVLKGAALAEMVYRDIGLRPMGDLDMLIKPAEVERALEALYTAGYRRAGKPELRPGFAREFQAEVELLSPGTPAVQVEIHWRLMGPIFVSRHIDAQGIWERALPVTLAGQPAYVLGLEDWLLHQAAHAVYKHRQINLQNLCDIDWLIRTGTDRINWEALLQIGENIRWLPALAKVFAAAVTTLHTPIPPEILQRIQAFRLPATEQRLIDWWLKPGRSERLHVIPDWLTLPTMVARLRILWAYLWPSREYIQACYPGQAGWRLLFYYLYRLVSEPFLNYNEGRTNVTSI